jgi:uncharacterized phage-associated protein
MNFTFDINKSLAAVGYICSRNKGKADILKLLKILYVADRTALIDWKRTITGDRFVSMDNGPVVSVVYDLIKGNARPQLQQVWSEYIDERNGNTIALKKVPDIGYLSDREIKLLGAVFEKISPMSSSQLIDWLHKLPEWENPNGSSKKIDPRKILKFSTTLTDQQISGFEDEITNVNYVRALLQVG